MEHVRHGGDLTTCRERYPGQEFLDFSANINPLGMPQSVRDALAETADGSLHYPDNQCRALRAALSEFEGVPDEHILCGNGASDLIFRIAFALKPQTALVLAPTFGEYAQAVRQVGCRVLHHMLYPEQDFAVDRSILSLPDKVDIVFLCNPNNPGGGLTGRELLMDMLDACKRWGAVIVVDECFLDFIEDSDAYTLKGALAGYGNLVILRAFTKIFAMPGLRLGYALCGNQQLLEQISYAGAPWSVSVPAQLCGIAAAGEREFVARTVSAVAAERAYLRRELSSLGLRVFTAHANYLMFRTNDMPLAENLLAKGIVIRDCSDYHGLASGYYYRVAVRNRTQNNALLGAIKETLVCKR